MRNIPSLDIYNAKLCYFIMSQLGETRNRTVSSASWRNEPIYDIGLLRGSERRTAISTPLRRKRETRRDRFKVGAVIISSHGRVPKPNTREDTCRPEAAIAERKSERERREIFQQINIGFVKGLTSILFFTLWNHKHRFPRRQSDARNSLPPTLLLISSRNLPKFMVRTRIDVQIFSMGRFLYS